jgi:hypothetical protein
MDSSLVEEDDLEGLSPFDLDWGIELPKQREEDHDSGHDTPRVDAEDYSEEEAVIFKVLRKHVRDACNVNTTWNKRKKALEWCFIRGEKDKNGIDFHTACMALGARPEVVLARLHHQLYVAGVPLREPLSIWIDRLPEQYESEAIMAAWDDGLALVKEVWRWPGIPIEKLESESGIPDAFAVLQKLEKAGLLAWRFGCVFLTGRSADRVKRRAFSWSKSFF